MSGSIPSYCGADASLVHRFVNNFRFLTKDNIGAHEENFLEKAGDLLKWPSIHLPGKIWNACKDPRILTLALGALAMLGDSYLFYTEETHTWVVWGAAMLPVITLERARFGSWCATMYEIAATTTRAFGRSVNTTLMIDFYEAPVPVAASSNDGSVNDENSDS